MDHVVRAWRSVAWMGYLAFSFREDPMPSSTCRYSTRALKGQGVNHYLKQFKFSHGSLEYYSCGYKIIRELMRDEEIIERGSSVGDYDDSLTDPYAETMLRHDEYSDRPFVVDREFVVLGK
ncbi:hypothetical protein AABB24_038303 [Solanum stoloniferum]|uniref:Uncharacterized protein n=1 Tax=Solanum stoloniferum TaxID=62892 RepID=A0ABD2QZG9_9SOLN